MITRRFKEAFSVMMKALSIQLSKNKFQMDCAFSFGASSVLFQSPLWKFSIIRSMLPVLPTQINFSIRCHGSLLSSTEFQELVSQEECLPTQQQNWQNTKQEGKNFICEVCSSQVCPVKKKVDLIVFLAQVAPLLFNLM